MNPPHVFVIAEAGVNHNGSEDLARALIDAAADAGADAVKFQTFRSEAVISRRAPKAEYQKAAVGDAGSQLDMVRRLELDDGAHVRLAAHATKRGIEFMSTPFDLPSLELLVNGLGVRRLKVPSGELTNGPLLLAMGRCRLPLIISTGMCTLAEVETALSVLAFGLARPTETPSEAVFDGFARSAEGASALAGMASVLQCTTEYPAADADLNLLAMQTLRDAFKLPVGLSDHSVGSIAAIAAVALGATVIEKHITLSNRMPGPDHSASMEPAPFAELVRDIRRVTIARGSGQKLAAASEVKNIAIARRSLVAARDIAVGETFTAENLTAKRPADGLSPMRFWSLLGQVAHRSYVQDEPISPTELATPEHA